MQGQYRGERLGDPVHSFLRADQSPLLLFPAMLDALRVRFTVTRDGSLAGRVQPDDLPFSFASDGSYTIAGRVGQLAPTEYLLHNGELYVTPHALALLAPVELHIDQREQRFTLVATGPLALDLTRQRELARSRFDNRSPPGELPLQAFPYQGLGRPFADVRLNAQYGSGSGEATFRSVSYDALISQELAFATVLLFVSGSDETRLRDARLRLGRQSPLGGVWGVPGLTSIFLGDVQTPALPLIGSTGQVRGVSLSAYPLDRPDRFDQTLVEGDAPPGWDAELLRGEELLDYQRVGADARYRFEAVPLLFGDNPLRVVLYGPDGQRREELRSFRIGSGMAPPGMLYWQASVGQLGTQLLERWLPAIGNAPVRGAANTGRGVAGIEAELGLSRRLTATVFATRAPEDHRPDSRLRDTAGGGLRLALPSVYLESMVASQEHRGQAWSVGASGAIGPLSLSARHAHYDGFRSREALQSGLPLRSETKLHLSMVAPIAGRPITLAAVGERWLLESGDREMAAQLQARFNSRSGLSVGQGIEWRRLDYFPGSPLAFRTGQLYYATTLSGRLGPVRLSAAARYDARQKQLDQLQLSGHWLISPKTSANFGAARNRSDSDLAHGYGVWAGLSRDFGSFHANAYAARSATGDWSASVGISLSFGFDGDGKLALSSRPMAEHGAADVLVFSDLDGNGRYDTDTDEPLANARLLVDGQRGHATQTNRHGRAFVTGLNTVQPVTLGIDPSSIGDPFMAPVSGGLRFMARPGQSYVAQLALVETGEISGTLFVVRDEERLGLSGVVVELLALRPNDQNAITGPGLSLKALLGRSPVASGPAGTTTASSNDGAPAPGIDGDYRVLGTKRTQYDGGFLFDMVPPGNYLVRVRAGQRIRGTTLASRSRPASVTREQLMVDGVELHLLDPIPDAAPDATESLDSQSPDSQMTPASREKP
ncbi:hypothetical protein [Montanilutibacter psychrotolerans]|uniref:hypothetical protein n=1 Tax=Montanilutibacter psychrotolerans TaxID=1327343 RepID=UPI0011CECFA7|nr:hypothetical protein [Lysobacter psychrotolerans]